MKKFRNAFRAVACCLVFASTVPLFACAGEDGKKPTTTTTTGAPTTTAPSDTSAVRERIESGLPANLDLDGETVTFLTRGYYDEEGKVEDVDFTWSSNEISSEELNNDPVNDAVYNRNIKIEDDLNVTIKEVTVPYKSDLSEMVRRDVASGDGEFDVVCGSVYYQTPLILEGSFYNLKANGIDTYLDLSKPWWSQRWLEEATMDDRLYCVTGSLALSLKRLLFVVYYNKVLAENEGIDNMYDVVRSGKWTMDYLSTTAKNLYKDLNGNSTRDLEDQYGLVTNHYECADIYWSSFDLSLVSKSEDGWYAMSNDKEKIANTFEMVYNLTYENQGVYDVGGTSGFGDAKEMFTSGNALFATLHLKYAESEAFRNMTDDYGILPTPKYDEKQKEYYTYAHDQYTVFMIPITTKHPDMVGAVLEAMACESYNSVEVAYYDNALKGRYSNDPDTREMLDLIVDGFKIDASWIYGNVINMPQARVFRSLIGGQDKGFAAAYAKTERVLPIALEELREAIEKFDH